MTTQVDVSTTSDFTTSGGNSSDVYLQYDIVETTVTPTQKDEKEVDVVLIGNLLPVYILDEYRIVFYHVCMNMVCMYVI